MCPDTRDCTKAQRPVCTTSAADKEIPAWKSKQIDAVAAMSRFYFSFGLKGQVSQRHRRKKCRQDAETVDVRAREEGRRVTHMIVRDIFWGILEPNVVF